MNIWHPIHETIATILARYDKEKDAERAVISIAFQLFERKWNKQPKESLPQEIKVFLLSYYAEGEIGNGGVSAFFYNGLGSDAEDTVAALTLLGLEKKATALTRGMASFPGGRYPKSIKEWDARKIPDDNLIFSGELDQLFYSEKMEPPLLMYVKIHFDKFAP